MTPAVLTELTAAGVSLWLDDLDRSRFTDGERGLDHLMRTRAIRGVTTNPTIFDRAVSSGGEAYADQLRELSAAGSDVDFAITTITTDDVRRACDLMRPVWETTGGLDGRVSIEVDPRLAHDTSGTIDQAVELWRIVDRPNAMIKIPATLAGLPAITQVLGQGISVNVTLIFSVERYSQVMQAHADGIRAAAAAGKDVSTIESVASFFVSRVDTAIDAQLDAMSDPRAKQLRGEAAIANARLAWAAYIAHTASDPWRQLAARGARPQRPLWASTGVKDPNYDPTRYVTELAAPGCVNTLPEGTLQAVAKQGQFRGDTMSGVATQAQFIIDELAEIGINIDAVCADLEKAGVASFIDSWQALRQTVSSAIQA
jgi:transaldolase